MNSMKADIFIPTSNRLDALTQCLESLDRQSLKNFRVLLVGMRPDERVERLLERFPALGIDYSIQKKPGLIGAANEALARAHSEIFVRIDDDTILDPEWYEHILKTFEADPK